jgi:hypothetical protein
LLIAVVVVGCSRPIGFVYVVAFPSRELLGFAIVDGTGKVEPVPGSPFPAGAGAIDVAVAPSGCS